MTVYWQLYDIFTENLTNRYYDDEGRLYLPSFLWMKMKLINNNITCLEMRINTMNAALCSSLCASALKLKKLQLYHYVIDLPLLKMDNVVVSRVTSHKHLGVIFNNNTTKSLGMDIFFK